jgi:hypothetical protein
MERENLSPRCKGRHPSGENRKDQSTDAEPILLPRATDLLFLRRRGGLLKDFLSRRWRLGPIAERSHADILPDAPMAPTRFP